MAEPAKRERTLTDEQIRVTSKNKSVKDVLASAKPFVEEALETLADPSSAKKAIEVPPEVLRDLGVMVMADAKMKSMGGEGTPHHDVADHDHNPFNRFDWDWD